MPNNSYLRSAAKERELVNKYRSEGYISARSAGSKSAIDVWAFHPEKKELILTQIKTEKGGRKLVVTVKERWENVTARFDWYSYEKEKKARRVRRPSRRSRKVLHPVPGQGRGDKGPDLRGSV